MVDFVLTGDVTNVSGSLATTLATVNANVGSFGSSSAVPIISVDAKGRITSVSTAAISGGGSGITALTGDVTATGPGSVAATLATVNTNVGAFGSATVAPVITVNAKGLVTGVSTATITPAWGSITGTPTTVAGYAISDAVTLTGTQTLSNKTLDNTNAITIKGASLTLQDATDTTKVAKLDMATISTATTRTFTFPNVTGNIVVDSQPSPTLFSSTTAQTVNFATGVMATGNTKAINIGTGGASGSTTNIALGSATSGALGTLTINSPTVSFGTLATSLNTATADHYVKAPAPTSLSAATTLTNAHIQSGIIQYTGAAAALTLPLGTTLDGLSAMSVGSGIDLSVINTGTGAATITANTGVTIVGAAAVATATSARWRIRKTATSTYIAYRLS